MTTCRCTFPVSQCVSCLWSCRGREQDAALGPTRESWEVLTLPWAVLRYPAVVNYGPAWSGPLTEGNVAAIVWPAFMPR